jgi:hypothetical protein
MIRFLLLAFPRAWRRRYAAELEELVHDVGGLRTRLAFDIVRVGLAERRAVLLGRLRQGGLVMIGPAWRHPGAWALAGALLALPTALFVVGSSAAYGMELAAARAVMDPVTVLLARWGPANALLALGPPLGMLLAVAPLLRFETPARSPSGEASVGIRLRSLNLAVAAACGALAAVLAWYFVGEMVLSRG